MYQNHQENGNSNLKILPFRQLCWEKGGIINNQKYYSIGVGALALSVANLA